MTNLEMEELRGQHRRPSVAIFHGAHMLLLLLILKEFIYHPSLYSRLPKIVLVLCFTLIAFRISIIELVKRSQLFPHIKKNFIKLSTSYTKQP